VVPTKAIAEALTEREQREPAGATAKALTEIETLLPAGASHEAPAKTAKEIACGKEAWGLGPTACIPLASPRATAPLTDCEIMALIEATAKTPTENGTLPPTGCSSEASIEMARAIARGIESK